MIVVALLSIPLAFSFSEMVKIHSITAQMETFNSDVIDIRDVQVQRTKPLKIALKIVSDDPLDIDQLDELKVRIAEQLDQEVELEVVFFALKR